MSTTFNFTNRITLNDIKTKTDITIEEINSYEIPIPGFDEKMLVQCDEPQFILKYNKNVLKVSFRLNITEDEEETFDYSKIEIFEQDFDLDRNGLNNPSEILQIIYDKLNYRFYDDNLEEDFYHTEYTSEEANELILNNMKQYINI